ncbi:MAG: hypothetical protein EZS28_009803, partial [Streblomastix strix]
ATFRLFRPVLRKVFVVCMMIAHKTSSDTPIGNKYFAQAFGMGLPELNEYEYTILEMMEYKTIVHNKRYDDLVEAVCGYEFGASTRVGKIVELVKFQECYPAR